MRHLWLIVLILGTDQLLKWHAQTAGLVIHEGSLYSGALTIAVLASAIIASVKYRRLGLTLILAGGGSNLLDWIVFQAVRDNFVIKNAAFNLADVSVIVGAAFIIVEIAKNRSQAVQEPQKAS